jgi:cell division protein FtsZ
MVFSSGPVRITRGDLKAVLGSSAAATYFGHGKSSGTNRLNEALERALKSRLLTRFSKVRPTDPVLLFLRGPSDLSFAEVQLAVAEVERVAGKECRVKVGVCPDGSPDSPLEVFVIASAGETQPASPPTAQTYGNTVAGTPSRAVSPAVGNAMTNPSPAIAPATRPAKGSKKVAAKQTQAVFNLDGYQRGRFDKSEPTIIEGEDLDVPTFIRKGIKLSSPPTH